MATKKKDEFGQWLLEGKGTRRRCETCSRYPEALKEDIRQYLILKAAGKTLRSNGELRDWLAGKYQYHLSVSALSIHMRRCEKELHSKIDRKDVSK